MSNRSYVIALVKQTFIHSWRTSTQTFVNSVSNKHMPAFLDQGATWFGAPATNVRRVSEANRIFNRTNPPIVAKIKDCENCTHAKFAQFSNNWQRFFFRHTFAIQVVNHWPTPIANTYGRALVALRAHALAFLETTLPSWKGKRLSQPWHMNSCSYVGSATCRAQLFPLCYESQLVKSSS